MKPGALENEKKKNQLDMFRKLGPSNSYGHSALFAKDLYIKALTLQYGKINKLLEIGRVGSIVTGLW